MNHYEEKKPRKASRLPQGNKSNKLLRRFYSGRAPVAQVKAEKVLRHGETIY